MGSPEAVSEIQKQQYISERAMEWLRESRAGRAAALGGALVALAGGGELASPDKVEATGVPSQTTQHTANNVMYTQTASNTLLVGNSVMNANDVKKITFIGNHRTVSKAVINRAQRRGRCVTMSGAEAMRRGIYTEGYTPTGVGFAPENRRSTLCDIDGDGDFDVRKECGNEVQDRSPRPERARNTIWVNNINSAKATIVAKLSVEAVTGCSINTPNGSVYATARGSASNSIRATVNLRTSARARGSGISSVTQSSQNRLEFELRQAASADAQARCYQQGGQTSPNTPTPPPEQPPQQPYNAPPTVDLVDQQHTIAGGRTQVCAYGRDPENAIVYRDITESGDGNFVSELYAGNEPGEFCKDFQAGTSSGTAVFTATVRDAANNTASETESWPIIYREF